MWKSVFRMWKRLTGGVLGLVLVMMVVGLLPSQIVRFCYAEKQVTTREEYKVNTPACSPAVDLVTHGHHSLLTFKDPQGREMRGHPSPYWHILPALEAFDKANPHLKTIPWRIEVVEVIRGSEEGPHKQLATGIYIVHHLK